MKLLEDKILSEGKILCGDVLKVDSFINHRMDVDFICELGKEFYNRFKDCGVNKILTIEASGIGIACLTAQYFHCPVVFAKKSKSANSSDDFYMTDVKSYTRGNTNKVIVSKEFLDKDDKILIIDDFLAMGQAVFGLLDLIKQAGATAVGAGIVIEKGYQPGGNLLRADGLRVESLAIVKSMDENGIVFDN